MEAPITLAKLVWVQMERSLLAAGGVNPDFVTTDRGSSDAVEAWRKIGFAALAIVVWFASVLFIAVIPALFLFPYLASNGIPLSDVGQIAEFAKNDQTAIFLQIASIVPAHLLTLLLAYAVVSQGRKFEFLKTLGWESGGVRWWHYCTILGAFFVIAAIVGSFVPEQDNDLLRLLRSSRYAVYVVAFVATFTAPLIEEVIYRGVLYSAFQRAFGVPVALFLVTLLFALVHVPQYYPSYSTILLLTLLSVTLTGLRVWSNNIWPCVVLHTIFNGLQSVVLIAEPWMRTMVDTNQ